jgi:xanthine dehydrogenase YagR molybdenum-binding subunit
MTDSNRRPLLASAPDLQVAGRGLIGQPIARLDGPLKVQGQATFAAEFPIDGMVYAALAFSTVAKGRIAALDVGAAEAAPGVVLVMTHQNAPPMGPMPMMVGPGEADFRPGGGDNLAVMQDDQVYWNGQPIAVVLAETQEQANYASTLIRASYEAQPAVTTLDEAKATARARPWCSVT